MRLTRLSLDTTAEKKRPGRPSFASVGAVVLLPSAVCTAIVAMSSATRP